MATGQNRRQKKGAKPKKGVNSSRFDFERQGRRTGSNRRIRGSFRAQVAVKQDLKGAEGVLALRKKREVPLRLSLRKKGEKPRRKKGICMSVLPERSLRQLKKGLRGRATQKKKAEFRGSGSFAMQQKEEGCN